MFDHIEIYYLLLQSYEKNDRVVEAASKNGHKKSTCADKLRTAVQHCSISGNVRRELEWQREAITWGYS